MKRLIIICLLIVSILFGCIVVVNGVEIEGINLKISSYSEIEDYSDDMTKAVANYNKVNDETYSTLASELQSAVKTYESKKEEYEELVEELSTEETVVESTEEQEEIITATSVTIYEIDFLWARIGNYAKSEGLTLKLSVTKSTSSSTSSLGYDLYNLSFSVAGEYIDIADFLYDLEDDDELAFEIRDYSMVSKAATFTVYNVPIDSETLLETTLEETTNETSDTTNTTSTNNVTNTSDAENTTDTNSTNTASTTNTTNTTNTSNTTDR